MSASSELSVSIGQTIRRRLAALPRELRWRRGEVPLAFRNILIDKRRFIRSSSGIAFAVLLMLLQLGFRGAFLDSALAVIRSIDGDIILTSATKFRFGRKDPFSRRILYEARAVEGVASARPVYAEWSTSIWKNPQTRKTYTAQVLAFDPDQPVFSFPEVADHLEELRQPDTALYDSRARRFLGTAAPGTVTELAFRNVRVVGTFALGPDFTTDGTIIMSDRNFLKFFAGRQLGDFELADIEFGVIKVNPAYTVDEVHAALKKALPASVAVLTKDELIGVEVAFQNSVSPVGPIFMLGTAIGFIVGMMISYQILYTDLSDQLPQYATLKAMGYENGYLMRVVLQQAGLCGIMGFLPAWGIGMLLYRAIGAIALLPLRMTPGIVITAFTLTVGMCLLSGALAMRRVLAADPAEVF
jgi:putative ABC transport system permease protein